MASSKFTEAVYANKIEPQSLITHFLHHPPQSFNAFLSPDGLPCFETRFDLLTTADDEFRLRVSKWPGYSIWRRFLSIKTNFVGTTVSEYSPLPTTVSPQTIVSWLQKYAPEKQLLIVKDLPQDSPLLSHEDNQYSREFSELCLKNGFISVEGQALAYVPMDFSSIDEYLSRMSHGRRRDIRRKLRSRERLQVEILHTGDVRFADEEWFEKLYGLYRAVYDQSEIHFDLLMPEFFRALLSDIQSNGRVFCYWHNDELVGYNVCYQHDGMLIDKYIGLNYPLALECNLYFVSWFVNLEYAINNNLRFYVAGWTDPKVKASLGARFTLTRHLVWVRNPVLRKILNHFRHHFESDAQVMAEK